MNIAGAQTIPVTPLLPPSLNALAQLTFPDQAKSIPDASSLDAFLSLLSSLGAEPALNDSDGPVVLKSARQSKEENKKDSLAVLFPAVPMPPPDTQRSLTVAFPAMTTAGASHTVSVAPVEGTARALVAVLPPDMAVSCVRMMADPAAFAHQVQMDPTQEARPLSPAPPVSITQAPIAFALRLDEATPEQKVSLPDPQRPPLAVQPSAPADEISIERSSVHDRVGIRQTEPTSMPSMAVRVQPGLPGRTAAQPAQSRPEPLAATAVEERPHDSATPVANTKDATRKQAQPQETPSPDTGSTKAVDEISLPSVTHPMDSSRGEPVLAKNADPRSVTRANTQPARTEATALSGPSPVLRASATREISMRLTGAESSTVDVKLIDRAGSVHVAVRTGDADLTRTLQSGLGELVHRLERKGFETEVWSPGDASGSALAAPRQSHSDGSHSQESGKDSRDGGQQGNAQQNNGRNRPKWIAELDKKLATADFE